MLLKTYENYQKEWWTMKFKSAIFDLDGTLIDSMPIWENIGAEFLKSKGIVPPENLSDTLKTMSFEESSKYFIGEFGLKLSVDEVISEFNIMVEDKYKYEIGLKSYVIEYLKKLKSKNIRMSIVTATDKELSKTVLSKLKVLKFFNFILTSGETGMGKDNPKIYIQAAEILGTLPNETIVFEDALHCVKAAKEAGFYVVGVYDKSAEEDKEEIKRISDIYIESFEDLKIDFYK